MKIILFILFGFSNTRAAELVEFHPSVRALGMGNAYTSVVSDRYSLWYNPAGLTRVRGVDLTVIDFRAGVDGVDVVNTVNDTRSNTNYVSTLQNLYGKNIYVGLDGISSVVIPGFAAAAYDSVDIGAHLSNPAYPNLDLRAVNDYGFAMGFSVDLFPMFTFGLTAQKIFRSGAEFPVGLSTLSTLSNQALIDRISNSGQGYAATAGILLTVPTPLTPRLGFAWKNMGQTTFTKDTGSFAPPPLVDEMAIGGSLEFNLPLLLITPSLDFKYMTNYQEQIGKKLHAGIEFAFPLISVRGGLNQGYYTVGTGINLGLITIDAATYGEELGEYPGQKEDRRYLVEVSIDLGFDPKNFSFLKSGTRSNSGPPPQYIKQRR